MATVNLTEQTFDDVIERRGIVLVDWWAAWCGPCRAFAPVYEALSARHPEVTFAKVDIDALPELASAFAIRAVPTLMAFRDGVPVYVAPGAIPGAALTSLIEHISALDMDVIRRRIAEAEAEAAAEADEAAAGGAGR